MTTIKIYQYALITSASKVTASSVTTLNLTLNTSLATYDGSRIVLRFAPGVSIPADSANLAVTVTIDGSTYPLLDRYGNPMLGGELKMSSNGTTYCPRVNYLTYYGNSTPHLIAHNFPKSTCAYYAA